jgi:hypothetical protein
MTDSTMAKIKRAKGQTMAYKILHRKLNTEQHEPTKILMHMMEHEVSCTGRRTNLTFQTMAFVMHKMQQRFW